MNSNERSEPDVDRRVLTVRVASLETVFDDLADRFDSLDAGHRPDPQFEVIVKDEVDLNRLLRPNNVELLRTISREQPESIRATARLVDRDVRQVHDDLHELARLNLVRFEERGSAKRPVVWYDEIEVELPISGEEQSTASA